MLDERLTELFLYLSKNCEVSTIFGANKNSIATYDLKIMNFKISVAHTRARKQFFTKENYLETSNSQKFGGFIKSTRNNITQVDRTKYFAHYSSEFLFSCVLYPSFYSTKHTINCVSFQIYIYFEVIC